MQQHFKPANNKIAVLQVIKTHKELKEHAFKAWKQVCICCSDDYCTSACFTGNIQLCPCACVSKGGFQSKYCTKITWREQRTFFCTVTQLYSFRVKLQTSMSPVSSLRNDKKLNILKSIISYIVHHFHRDLLTVLVKFHATKRDIYIIIFTARNRHNKVNLIIL